MTSPRGGLISEIGFSSFHRTSMPVPRPPEIIPHNLCLRSDLQTWITRSNPVGLASQASELPTQMPSPQSHRSGDGIGPATSQMTSHHALVDRAGESVVRANSRAL